MSKSNNTTNELAVTALAGTSSGGNAADRLAELMAVKIAKELEQEKTEAANKQALREAQIAGVKQMLESRALGQAQCPHMKPNFRPAMAGQKDHRGNAHFICQYCQKEYGNDLPMHLRIPADQVGGPQ